MVNPVIGRSAAVVMAVAVFGFGTVACQTAPACAATVVLARGAGGHGGGHGGAHAAHDGGHDGGGHAPVVLPAAGGRSSGTSSPCR